LFFSKKAFMRMKSLKMNMSVLALLLGVSAATFAAVNKSADRKWGLRSNGQFVDVTSQSQGNQYLCSGLTNTCTEMYPEGVNPNDQENDQFPGVAEATDIISGNFSN
jgi:hypothetical protein